MSSEDDEYYYKLRRERRHDRRKPTRPRRRSSVSSRRRSSYGDAYSHHRNRRSKSWYSYQAARLMATCVFVSLVGYEVFILKAPLTTNISTALPTFNSQSSRSSGQNPSTNAPTIIGTTRPPTTIAFATSVNIGVSATSSVPQHPEKPNSPSAPAVQPASAITAADIAATIPVPPSVEGSKTLSEVPADADAESDKVSSEPANYRPLKRKRTSLSPPSSSSSRDLPASALRIGISGPLDESLANVSDGNPVLNNSDTEQPVLKSEFTTVNDKESSSAPPTSSTTSGTTNAAAEKSETNVTDTGGADPGGANPGAGENFWRWFQETKDDGKGTVSDTVNCPEENKRLCTMFYKYIRKYKIRSVYDVSCVKNLDWMPEILQKAGSELWGFKYYCSATDEDGMAKAKEKLSSMKFVEFISELWWRQGFGQKPELLFAWDTLAHTAYGRVWHFFVKAKSQNIKYILVDNYPGILNDPVRIFISKPRASTNQFRYSIDISPC